MSVFISTLALCLAVLMKQPGRSRSISKSKNWLLPLRGKFLCLLLSLKTHPYLYQVNPPIPLSSDIMSFLTLCLQDKGWMVVWYGHKHGLVSLCLSSFVLSLPPSTLGFTHPHSHSTLAVCLCCGQSLCLEWVPTRFPLPNSWSLFSFSLIAVASWKAFHWFQKSRFDLA